MRRHDFFGTIGSIWLLLVKLGAQEAVVVTLLRGGSPAHLQIFFKCSVSIDMCRIRSVHPTERGKDLGYEWTNRNRAKC